MLTAAPQLARCLALVLTLLQAPSAQAVTKSMMAAAMESITADELYNHVAVLSDDIYEGRAAGSRGGQAAARYLIQKLRAYPMEPAGTDGDYIQSFEKNWRNILVLQPGDDPKLAEEIIIVGAHYDHVGYGDQRTSYGPIGQIHNGADDNASGVAVLLETIDAFAQAGLQTRRSILFAFWDGEERDLAGSRYWVANPTLPLKHVKLTFTVDMVGRLRKGQLYALGTRSGYGLRRLLSGPVEEPLWLDFSWEINANSDHWSFYERQIPGVLLHTGLHYDYHRPSDDVEKIDHAGMREVTRYLLAAVVRAANEDQLPAFRSRGPRENESMQRVFEQPLPSRSLDRWPSNQPRPRLGLSWREDEAEPGTVLVTRVVKGSPAAAAGFDIRDRIYALDGQTYPDASAFHADLLRALDEGVTEIKFLTERRGQLRTRTAKLPSLEPSAADANRGPTPGS